MNHLQSTHNIPVEEKETSFTSFDEFKQWKENIEMQTNSLFVLKCAPYKSLNQQTFYYYCNRSGEYKPKGEGTRQLKTQGTSKMGHQCSAYMKTTCSKENNQVNVHYCTTHYNHTTKLAFLKIPDTIRQVIGKKE